MLQNPHQSSLNHFAPHVAQYVEGPIRVRAIMKGQYGHSLRVPCDNEDHFERPDPNCPRCRAAQFGIHSHDDLAPWMELIGVTGADDAEVQLEPPKKAGKGKKSENDVL